MPGGDGSRTLGVYIPTSLNRFKIGCVFVAPAGSTGFVGNALENGEGNPPEILPYVRAGYAVVSYSLDGGNVDKNSSDAAYISAIDAFRGAHYGSDNEKAAVNYALAHIPNIDHNRLFLAGHSSAGMVALIASESDPRIRACIAYAPASDLHKRLPQDAVQEFTSVYPDFPQVLTEASPITNINRIKCPVFMFHADDDSNVPSEDVETLVNQLKTTNFSVTYSHVPSGDHYESMVNEGVPQGIRWLSQFK